ncbi:spore coat polysaccharide biosynthesis protein F, CMP-KDO synthetase [Thermanaerovibrio velox DSM 12556]|uniref:Spore coat polysaccharide biosynthesis protein F, CMP-KDO synthetase n=1 Tax=Thermanaerovibrio velox DSM 12556 TaxID=926567 RepID=H0USF5_9BACT|nr:glycosyltransferase family protein [Thermanaerovibrio velox]EHM10244.1 spore coat polysaccharide biosynthesis protein F, CMP-KDO synthetase [Thermanaerovibrio velox DSM 12556]
MILAVLQARVSSSRLPGKVLAEIMGVPMILRQIERVRRSRRVEALVLATSTEQSDDPLAELCEREGIDLYRGSLSDVLDRFHGACITRKPDHVVRLTGDCPLADPKVIDDVIELHLKDHNDYTSNTLCPTFPDGLDVEVMRFSALEEAFREATLPSEREHVTPFIHKRPKRYKLGCLKLEGKDLSSLRWTVDEPEDFRFVCKIYEALYPKNPAFGMSDVLKLLEERPELVGINSGFIRNEGYLKSLAEDEKFLRGGRLDA